jgi:2-succinyl-6-hydroxy-2,4-cyclohexadiene-1-carboxylate synthase
MPDLPGHGRNLQLPLSQPLNFDSVVAGLQALLLHLRLDGASLVGYSLGGRIALYAATKFPPQIKALVLESCQAGITGEQMRRDRAEADDRQARILLAEGMESFVEQWYNLDLFKTLRRRPQLWLEIKEKRKKNDPRWMAKIISELSAGRQPPLWNQLGSLPLPVLLVAGGLDAKYVELMVKMGNQIPGATTEIFPDAGHNVHLEHPEKFTKIVKAFLQDKLQSG